MVMKSIQNRRSIRKYTETAVTEAQVQTILEAAMLSPSACNTRPWRFVVITNRDLLNDLAEAHPHAKMLRTAPMCIAVIALPELQENVFKGIPLGFFPQDCGAVSQSIILQATELGLGTCWCGVYPKEPLIEAVNDILELPANEIPFALIAIGEADEEPNQRGQYDDGKVSWVK